jgi:AraC-like DNA-binding protein
MKYREFAPSPRLAADVECFWSLEAGEARPGYPVLPDACVDIVFSRPGELRAVGTMTRPQRFDLPAGQFVCGVRFRPARSYSFLRVPGPVLTDQSVPLSNLWGSRADRLRRRLEDSSHPLAVLEAHLEPSSTGLIQQAAAWLVARHGSVRLDELARHAGLSPRQLRRRFLDETGLTPKQFCRILRFRHTLNHLPQHRGDWAGLAAGCGYYDQAHLIRDFHEFAGAAPGDYVRFFQSPAPVPALASGA